MAIVCRYPSEQKAQQALAQIRKKNYDRTALLLCPATSGKRHRPLVGRRRAERHGAGRANPERTGNLALANNGTINLTGTNTFTGGTLVNNGSLQIGNNPPVAGAFLGGPITNYSAVYFGRSDAFTLPGPITSAGNSFLISPGQLYLRTTAGMTVDGTAGIDLAGTMSVSQDVPGRLFVAPGASINLGGEILLGNPANISGEIIQAGGTVNVGNRMRLGHWGTEVSYYTMGGGTLNVANAINVGWDGIGIFTVNDGIVNCLSMAVDGNGNTGALSGTNETFSINGGRINIGLGGITTASTDGGYAVRLGGGTVGASASWSSSVNMSLTNGAGVTFDSGPNTITLTGILSGTNGLTKQGAGYLNLNHGSNSFSGPAIVAQGTLQGAGSVAGPVTVQPGAALSAGATAAAGTLTVSNNVTFNPGSKFVVDASTTAATSDRLDVRGALALDPAGTPVYFNFLGARPYTGGAYTIVSNLLPRTGLLTLANATRYTANLDQSNPNRIQVSFSGTNASLVWKGSVDNSWNVGGTANWLTGGDASAYFQSDAVIFDDIGIAKPGVALASEITPASVTVNAAGDYTFSGAPIAGLGILIKNGAGKLTLANDNTYTGMTSVGGGTLQIGAGGTTGGMVGNIADNSAVVFNRSDASTYPGVISGSGTLTQAGTGKLTLIGNSTFAGVTTINPGSTLQIGVGLNAGALGVGPINVPPGASLVVFRNDSPTIANQLTGSGTINLIGTGQTGAASGQSSYTLSASNTFSGTVTLDRVRINPANAYALGTTATYVVPANSTMWPNVAGAVFTPALTLSGSGWAENAGYLGAVRFNNGCTWAGDITLSGSTRISAYNDANNNRITGTINAAGYEMEFGAPGATSGQLTLAPASPSSYGVLRLSPGTLIAGNANALPNSLPLTMNGGTLRLNGINFTATTYTHLAAGSIQNGSANSPINVVLNFPANAVITHGTTFADAGTKPLNLTLNQSGAASVVTLSGDSGTWTGNFTNNGGAITLATQNTRLGANNVPTRFLVFNNATLNTTVNNAISGGNYTMPTVILNNSTVNSTRYNAYGPLVLSASTLTGNIGTSDANYWQYPLFGGRVTVIGNAPSYMAGTGTSAGYPLVSPTVFDVADVSSGDDLIVTAPLRSGGTGIGGTGALVKTGAGRMLVDSVATYTGATTISNGVLAIGANGSLATSPFIEVKTGATLDVSAMSGGLTLGAQTLGGGGSVVGNVTDSPTSSIRPGSGAGTLTLSGNLTLGGGGSLGVELANVTTVGASVNDLIQVNGDLSLNDATPTIVNFTFLNGLPSTAGEYTIIKYTGRLTGSIAGLTNSAGSVANFTLDTVAKAIKVSFTVPAQNLVWQGDGVNSWDFETASVSWFNGSVSTNFYQLDTVVFNDTRTTANTTVSINAAVTPASMTLNSTNDYVFTGTGKITGSTSITKNNINRVTLSTVNDFTGPIAVNGGTLALGVNDSLPTGTTVTVASGAAFDFADFNGNTTTRGNSFVIGGAGPDGNGAMLNSVAGGIDNYANVSNLTLTADSVIGGVARWDIGSLPNSKVDGGGFKLTKIGANGIGFRSQIVTNLAALVVTEGRMWHENFDRTNAWETTITNIASNGGRIGVYGGRTIDMPIVLDSGMIYNEGGGTPTWRGAIRIASSSVFNNSGAQNFYGGISGPGAMWVDGGIGALSLTNANTYLGGTVVSNAPATTNTSGTAGNAALLVANANALGTGALTIDGSAFSSLLTNVSFFLTNILRPVEFNVTGGTVVPNAINLPTTGSLISNVAIQGRDASSSFTLSGKISGGFVGLTNWFDNGSGNVGVIRLSNPANDFVASRIYLNRGILALTVDALGSSGNTLFPSTNSTVRFDAPNLTLTHPILVAANPTYLDMFGDNNGDGVPETINNVTLSGIISGAGTLFPRGTNGTLTLTGNSTFTGGFELQQPLTLQVGASANLGTSAYVAIKFGSTFRYTGTGSETMTRILYMDSGGGGTIDIPNASATLTWNPTGGTVNQSLTKTGLGALTYGGVISGNGLVNLNGGTLTLNGANTYTSPTLVNAGSLFVNGSIAAGSVVRVASGGTLAGTGTINCPVNLQPGSFLKPGVNGIGTLNIISPLALSPGTVTTMELNGTDGTCDRIASLSSVAYGGTLTVNNLGAEPAVGARFVLFSAVQRFGSFSAVTLPPLTGGRSWKNTLATDGSITVVSGVNTTPTDITAVVSGGNLNLSWPDDYVGWRLEAQTNSVVSGLSTNWVTVPGSSSVNAISIPLDPANPSVFYRLVYP